MRKLLIHLKDYKKESILAPLFKMLEAAFELFIPIVMKSIIDVGIKNGDKMYIFKMCTIMIALGIIGLVCSITAQYYSAKAAVGFSTILRQRLFDHIQDLGFSEMDKLGTSTMITRMTSDINQIQAGVNMVLRLFMRSPFIVIGAMIMAFTIDVQSALIFLISIPVLSIIVFGVMFVSIPLYKKVQIALDTVLKNTRENLIGARVIRAFHKEEEEIETFKKNNEILKKLQLFVGRILAFMNPVTYIIVNAAIVGILYIGAIRVNSGALTTGAVIALVSYMSQILIELIKLANLIISVTKAFACGNRVQSIFEIHPLINKEDNKVINVEEKNTKSAFIEFRNVALKYHNEGENALSEVNLKVEKGETIGIIGGTGSGKSSFVSLLPRFYDATEGELLIDGVDVKDYNIEDLRRKIGIVMQRAILFKGTIKENLYWGKKNASSEDIEEALEISQSKEFVLKKDKGIDSFIEQGGKNLSGGQKQRLTIARALVRKPEILILDDSASALDFATDAKLRAAIRKMKSKPTVFIVSQRTSAIEHANKIVVLDEGKVAGIGTHQELLETCQVYQEIYYSQYSKAESGRG
ncbi:ABC transporter ATP-binding protein [Clostridium intestinale]|uniref:ABC transporter ATP-binding protein n=1 Tax=Clostridium intestinale TaxID=36845 RepID=UPI002DD680B6|nr:ABC transporter ATP-binding protein [Clostridium intestinale]WRY52198.1 ABC transporter ATP-binding protein [Clostridium intestinale]